MAIDPEPATLYGQLSRPELTRMVGRRPPALQAAWHGLRTRLATALGPDAVLADPGAVMAYSYDATGERHLPQLVVVPQTPDQVGMILREAASDHVPVLARGAGTNLSGGTMPLFGGVVLALQRLKGPLAVDRLHLHARVPVGMVNADLQRVLEADGLFFAPDPSSHRISTIGGNVQENSGGPHCVKYGVTTSHVRALSGFLVDGTPLRLARPVAPGELDLLGVVVGSEGTLVVGTAAEVELRVRPPATATALIAYRSVSAALEAVASIVAARLDPSSLELLDRDTMELVEPFVHAGYPVEADAVLLVEVEGAPDELSDHLHALDGATDGPGRLAFRSATTAEEAERLWLGRRTAYGALARASAHIFVQDVTVPRPLLAAMMADVVAIGQRFRLRIITVAHAGDGNLHPSIAYDPADPDEVERLHAADREILARAASRDGSITGEHGVGIDKLEHLPLMFTPAELAVMKGIKRVFDPELRLNPGKAIWTGDDLDVESEDISARTPPEPVKRLIDAVDAARSAREPLTVIGSGIQTRPSAGRPLVVRDGFTDISIDAANLTARVGAGVTVGELERALDPLGLEWAVDALDPLETVGGVIAGGLPALREAGPGPVRDQVLGLQTVDGRGRYLRFGRPVIKNVAGYDVPRLFVGSRGQLGIICGADLRLRPRKPLHWMALAVAGGELAAQAWASLSSSFWRPAAVIGRPGTLLTAWERDPGTAWGKPILDPRAEMARSIRDAFEAGFGISRCDLGLGPEAPFTCWWPRSGAVLGQTHSAGGDGPDKVAVTLQEGVRRVFDPDGVFRVFQGGDGR
jgi:glycolate oxidase